MRLRKRPGVKEAMETFPELVPLNGEEYKGKWSAFFGNDHPLHVELGTGKGRFVTTLAEHNPEINYIGVELREEVLISAVKKAQDKQLKNIAFLWININDLENYFGEAEVNQFYLNFSDPWPKKRHAARRLTDSGFLVKYERLLNPAGKIALKTDNEGLFEYSLNEFAAQQFLLQDITFNLHESPFAEGNVMTEYEAKFVEKGMKIYRCVANHPAQWTKKK
ncbi:tRNA (guanosine(46)-N7)-methyltransferase TrmB [Aneurinibacillus sp. Ricciae_BoGa-3]|uniref:tRNA (guanosine(46)-N7)-methyltransferase TrmB n=1 Tax=Aneurinibacillus sp. Ricciae_BoGa-3 TaxID=3022697 RepID=UPI0023427674|nr:tRNA (guanosine(46)-N7)-methyltransferase TrmB [Aneurinibacillus sp. Ricciae_BoGa-3]WCK55501.1 tRNA (guanosine(46)-N7)-methyltransferase TrmB [Aneurinibacillus sp. Ricciae_BoGa-3]